MSKSIKAYKTISEVVKILGLKSKKGQSLPTHTIRFWEKKSIQNKIDPKITNRIWKNMIWSYIDFERRNFKKK